MDAGFHPSGQSIAPRHAPETVDLPGNHGEQDRPAARTTQTRNVNNIYQLVNKFVNTLCQDWGFQSKESSIINCFIKYCNEYPYYKSNSTLLRKNDILKLHLQGIKLQ